MLAWWQSLDLVLLGLQSIKPRRRPQFIPSLSDIHFLAFFKMVLPTKILLALLPFFLEVNSQASGSGQTTRCQYTSSVQERRLPSPKQVARVTDTQVVQTGIAVKPLADGPRRQL